MLLVPVLSCVEFGEARVVVEVEVAHGVRRVQTRVGAQLVNASGELRGHFGSRRSVEVNICGGLTVGVAVHQRGRGHRQPAAQGGDVDGRRRGGDGGRGHTAPSRVLAPLHVPGVQS